ncbi:pol, partial [Symbiodinium necroappetens]
VDVAERMLRTMRRGGLVPSPVAVTLSCAFPPTASLSSTAADISGKWTCSLCRLDVVRDSTRHLIPADKVTFSCLINAALELNVPDRTPPLLAKFSEVPFRIPPEGEHCTEGPVCTLQAVWSGVGKAQVEMNNECFYAKDYVLHFRCYVALGNVKDAEKLFQQLDTKADVQGHNLQPDDITLGALLDACMAENDQTVASEISELFLKKNEELNRVMCGWAALSVPRGICTLLIKGFVRGGGLQKALALFESMKQARQFFATPRFLALTLKEFRLFHYFRWRAGSLEHRQMSRVVPDIIAYSVLIKGLVDQHHLKQALDILEELLLQYTGTYGTNNPLPTKHHSHEETQQLKKRPRRRGGTQPEHNKGEDMAATKQTQQRENDKHKQPGQSQPEEESHGGGGRTYSNSTTETGTAFELIPVGLVHRNLEPEQWVLRIRNLPSPNSRDPASAPLHARKYLLTWRPKTTSWVLGDLTEEEGDAYRASAMVRGPPVPDMSALAQDHELDYLSVSPERYADVRMARAKTQFPLEDPYQPRGGRREELRQIAAGEIPAMPPPPDRIYYAPSASQVPASSHPGTPAAENGQQAHTRSPQEQQQQQQQTPVGGGRTQQQAHDTPTTGGGAAISFYSQEARSAFTVTKGENSPQQGEQQRDSQPAHPKAPPPKPPSSSEDEWPSEDEAPPEEEGGQAPPGDSLAKPLPLQRGEPPTHIHRHPVIRAIFQRSNVRGRSATKVENGGGYVAYGSYDSRQGGARRINPAQMAATLVEVVRHILRGTLHATSARTELAEVGELLEDVVADFGASIRLRDSAGIAEGRDALMEAVDILDQIVLNYNAEQDECTMDPATLQDDLLRLAQQLQIVVPAHNDLLGDIPGELPSQSWPSSSSQELFEGCGDEMGLMQQLGGGRGEHHVQRPQTWSGLLQQIRGELNNMPLQCRHACVRMCAQLICRLHRPGPDPAGDTEEGHQCAIQLLSVLENEFPESYRTNGQYEAEGTSTLDLRGAINTTKGTRGTATGEGLRAHGPDAVLSYGKTQQYDHTQHPGNGMGRQQRDNYAAEAMELITEAMGLANDVGMRGVVDYLAAAATRLSQLHTIRVRGTNRTGTPLPTPNAFEIAALTVGVMEESNQHGEQPSMAELLELLELVQAGMAYNWQVTHWATDAAEEALALLTGAGRNDTADTIAQDRGQPMQHPQRDPPDALHVYRAQRALRQLHPFLEGEMRVLGEQALDQLGAWIQSHWGEEVQLLSSDEEAPTGQQNQGEEKIQNRGDAMEATMPDGDSGAASSTAPFT